MDGQPQHASRILIVDDSVTILHLIGGILRGEGYDVTTANDGGAGLDLLQKEAFDLVLLDAMMPDLDGFETCRLARDLPGCQDMPIVFLTGMTDADTQQQALESGGDDFLSKPISRAALLLRVRSLLRLGRLRAEDRRHQASRARMQAIERTAERRRTELVEFLLHDLELPASRIRNAAGRLGRLLSRTPEEDKLVSELDQAADELDRMTANLLDASRIGGGRLAVNAEAVDVAALLQAAASGRARRARQLGITLTVDVAEDSFAEIVFRADEAMLRRVLENLLDNALRYTEGGGSVRLEGGLGPSGDLEIRVRDNGVLRVTDDEEGGVTSTGSAPRGSGLGLLFCRVVAESHDGRLRVGNEGDGTCVTLGFPVDEGDP